MPGSYFEYTVSMLYSHISCDTFRGMKTNNTPYSLISQYRTPLMGLATLWVMYNHAMLLGLTATQEPFRFLQLAAHISVDIFFMLSGFGLYHSLSRNTTKDYFLKRLGKLMPVWGSFLLAHIIIDKMVFGLTFSLKEIIGFLTFQGFRAQLGNQGNWYVYTIFLYYLIAPIPFSFLKESKHKLTTCGILCAVSWIAAYSYFGNRDLLITFIRIPAFLLGMYMASGDEVTKKEFSKKALAICLGITAVFGTIHFFVLSNCSVDVLWDYGLWWHALIPMTVPFSLLICRLFALTKNPKSLLLKPLELIGAASLEIFLAHLYIFKYWGEITGILLQKSVGFRIAVFFASILIGLVWHALIKICSGLVSQIFSHPSEKTSK